MYDMSINEISSIFVIQQWPDFVLIRSLDLVHDTIGGYLECRHKVYKLCVIHSLGGKNRPKMVKLFFW